MSRENNPFCMLALRANNTTVYVFTPGRLPLINADKPHLWKADIAASVDLFNAWFMQFAPEAYRTARIAATQDVKQALLDTSDLLRLTPIDLKAHPKVLPVLRMSTAPPIARDRLIGLAGTKSSLVNTLEKEGRVPPRMAETVLDASLEKICHVITRLLDRDIFPWLEAGQAPSEPERTRAATIVADRLCGAVADPTVRNDQERRQLSLIDEYLTVRGYAKRTHPSSRPLTEMEPGTFGFRMNIIAGNQAKVNIPMDIVIQPKRLRPDKLPVLIEAKSAGDFTNTNKRRKEEAQKIRQLKETYGPGVQAILFLCGYFGSDYLGYEAAEGWDWVWEHRIDDLAQSGI